MKEELDAMGGGKFRVSFLNLQERPSIDIARMDYWGGYSGMNLGAVGQSDLGIIELKQDSPVVPVALKSLGAAESEFKLLGYGPRAKGEIDGMNKYLGVARVAKQSFSHCQNLKEDLRVFDGYEICASGIAGRESGACHGDSGGALLDSTGALVGVTSWGAEENCEVAPAKRQTVFARVWPGMIWLRSQTGAELGGLPLIPKNVSKPVFRKADVSFKHGRIRISTQWQDTTGTKISGSTFAAYGLMPKRSFKYRGIEAGEIDAKSLNVSAKIPARISRMSVKKYPYWLVVMYVSAYNGYHNGSPEKLVVKFVRRRG